MASGLHFDNTYAALPEGFFAHVTPSAPSNPRTLALNLTLADELGIDQDWLQSTAGLAMVSGQKLPEGSTPIATAYAGHQFGNFVPQLGDGRAMLIGEVIDHHGNRKDIQLKGAGLTPFSRGGDGKAAIGPVLREYIVSEAMHALGIPTTRALAAVTTGDKIIRDGLVPGAVLTRVASSHIRVGTFQFFHVRDDLVSLKILADYAIDRHYPEARQAEHIYAALLLAIMARQAALIAQWMSVGFIHGVMNTDNMSIAGETIDFGPCAFMDQFDPKTVFSAIDHGGRYAYGNQPQIGQWNLSVLAQTFLPLLDDSPEKAIEHAKAALNIYNATFQQTYEKCICAKLGFSSPQEGDLALWQDLTKHLTSHDIDYTRFFRLLSKINREADDTGADAEQALFNLFEGPTMFGMWFLAWRSRLNFDAQTDEARQKAMLAANPAYIPRNHLVQEALSAAENGDMSLADKLMEVLSKPFLEREGFERYLLPPEPHEVVQKTFCGT